MITESTFSSFNHQYFSFSDNFELQNSYNPSTISTFDTTDQDTQKDSFSNLDTSGIQNVTHDFKDSSSVPLISHSSLDLFNFQLPLEISQDIDKISQDLQEMSKMCDLLPLPDLSESQESIDYSSIEEQSIPNQEISNYQNSISFPNSSNWNLSSNNMNSKNGLQQNKQFYSTSFIKESCSSKFISDISTNLISYDPLCTHQSISNSDIKSSYTYSNESMQVSALIEEKNSYLDILRPLEEDSQYTSKMKRAYRAQILKYKKEHGYIVYGKKIIRYPKRSNVAYHRKRVRGKFVEE